MVWQPVAQRQDDEMVILEEWTGSAPPVRPVGPQAARRSSSSSERDRPVAAGTSTMDQPPPSIRGTPQAASSRPDAADPPRRASRPRNRALRIDDADRYSRLRLISWWRQERLAAARVLVVGAGALGNEVIKNLALVGVGTTF